MNYNSLFKKIQKLNVGETKTIIKDGDLEIFVIRPTNKFKNYDIKKNFQIYIKDKERQFRPNHLRVMIDLHLRTISKPSLKSKLLLAFDEIYYKKNSFAAIKNLENEKFKHSLNSLKITAVLSQLFLIEQELNYTKKSNYVPVTLFYQGWIRQSIHSSKEIDNLVMSICRFQPPNSKYTNKENKQNKKFVKKLSSLWYLD